MATKTDFLFATPLIQHTLEGSSTLNAQLRTHILKAMKDDPNGIRRSNTGGWHSDTDMTSWAPEECRTIFSEAMAQIGPLTADTYTPKRQFGFDGQIWANVSGPGHSNQTHCHTGALWSGVYYVDPGGDAVEGELILEDPRFPMNQMYMPGLVTRGADGQPAPSQHAITPRAGLMVLFPSWLKHSVRPYRGTGQRISVAFNLMVKPEG
jgi:uncharacterized protein (TIGR02466 family)